MIPVSVIVCHHTGNFVPAMIASVRKSICVEPEIIVVTSDKSASFDATTIYANTGPAEKRNIGAKFAKSDYLFFLDDDTELAPTFLNEMVTALKKPGVGMAYGKTLNMERRKMLDNAGSYLTWTGFLWAREESGQVEDKGQFDTPEYIFAGKGAAMALRRDTFEKVGGFDPVYEILAEETDISWKVWFIGEKVVWVPKAVLYHAFNTRFKKWSYFYTDKRVFQNGSHNYISMLSILLEWKNWFRIVPITFTVWFLAGIGMFFTKKPSAGFHILKGLFLVFTRWKNILERRKFAQSLRTKSDKELFKTIMRQPKLSFYWKRFFFYLINARHG